MEMKNMTTTEINGCYEDANGNYWYNGEQVTFEY
jgi:hypothetical protein